MAPTASARRWRVRSAGRVLATAAAEAVDLATVALGRPTRAAIAAGEHRLELVTLGRWWTVVVVAPGRRLGADPFGDQAPHLHGPLATVQPGLDAVADVDR